MEIVTLRLFLLNSLLPSGGAALEEAFFLWRKKNRKPTLIGQHPISLSQKITPASAAAQAGVYCVTSCSFLITSGRPDRRGYTDHYRLGRDLAIRTRHTKPEIAELDENRSPSIVHAKERVYS